MKKKKSVHLRRVRERSQNKSIKLSILKFNLYFDRFFLKKLKKSFSFYTFLLCFKAINARKIFYMFKIFGFNKYYVIKKKLNLHIFYVIFKRKYDKLKFNKKIKISNVENKKNLFLHVSYRHFLKLPVRGQRTRTNAKTRKHYAII